MTDAELQEVADDANSLTEVERATLRAEMPRRGMEEPKETNSELGEGEPRAPKPSYGDEQSAARSRDPEGFWLMIRLDWRISNAPGPTAAVREWNCQRLRAHFGRTGRNFGGVNPSRASSPADTLEEWCS